MSDVTALEYLRMSLDEVETTFEQYKHEQSHNEDADEGNANNIDQAEQALTNFRTYVDDLVP